MHPVITRDLANAHIADLHRQAQRDHLTRTARQASQAHTRRLPRLIKAALAAAAALGLAGPASSMSRES